MPLVIVCGKPCTGKSTVAQKLSDYLKETGHNVVIVSGRSLGYGVDAVTGEDDTTRALLRASVERAIAHAGTVVICDAPNEVRGFRYELHCISKARATPCCTIYCTVPDAVSDEWNKSAATTTTTTTTAAAAAANDKEQQQQRYSEETLTDMRERFEPPTKHNRWEKPLFTIEKDTDIPFEGIVAALFETDAPKPNMSTAEEAQSTAANMHTLDSATREVVSAVLRAVNEPSFVPGDTVSLAPAASKAIVLHRKVGPAELGRLRRQFVRMSEGFASSITSPAEAFAAFLASSL